MTGTPNSREVGSILTVPAQYIKIEGGFYMLVYLAGKITGLTREQAGGWRDVARDYLFLHDINAHNPLLGFDIDGEYDPCEIVARNKFYIQKSDIILAEMAYDEPSLGTVGEIVYANGLGKPVFTWGLANYNNNPWIKEHVTKHFDGIEDALDYIVTMYGE